MSKLPSCNAHILSRGGIPVYSIAEIRNALRVGRERDYVLFPEIRDPDNVKRVRENPCLSQLLEPFLQYGKEALKEDIEPQMSFRNMIEYVKSGTRSCYEKPWFRSKAQINSVVLLEIFSPDEENIRFLEERLWSWCDRYTWEFPAHVPLTLRQIEQRGYEADEVIGLFSAETGFYFAEILSIIGHKLDPLLQHRLKKEINRRIISAFTKYDFYWEEQRMNWSAVCAGCTGCAAIYLMDSDEELARIIHRLLGAFSTYFEGYYEDGLTPEGIGYWGYGFGFFLYFAQLLYDRTGGMLDLLKDNEFLEQVALFPAALQLSHGGTVNYSDSSYTAQWEANLAMASLLQRRCGRPLYTNVGVSIDVMGDGAAKWAHIIRGLFWGKDYSPESSRAPLQSGLTYFREAQWLIDKRRIDQSEIAFAAKGGHNDIPHNHNDLGHFILRRDDTVLFCDLGAPDYSRQYFQDETRYSFINAASLGHSVPVIDGCQQGAGEEFCATVLEARERDGATWFVLDLTLAYRCDGLARYIRTFIWDYACRTLRINDSFSFSNPGPHKIESMFITRMAQHDRQGYIQLENGAAELLYQPGATCEIYRQSFIANGSLSEEIFYRSAIINHTDGKEISIDFTITI